MRKQMTPSEARIWTLVRGRRLGAKFRRQHPIGSYVVDFVCLASRLVIEADGDQHEYSEYDASRDARLRRRGYRVLRFWNKDVAFDPEWVEQTIKEWLADPHRGLDGERYPD